MTSRPASPASRAVISEPDLGAASTIKVPAAIPAMTDPPSATAPTVEPSASPGSSRDLESSSPAAAITAVAFVIAATPLAGNIGLAPGTVSQVVVKTSMGAVVAFTLLAPLVLDAPGTPHRLLGSTLMVTLGRWSYGLFIWHLAALDMVFPVIGEFPFTGYMPLVLVLTLIFGFAIAAVSYALIESPCREALRRWESRKAPVVLDSAITDLPEPAPAR